MIFVIDGVNHLDGGKSDLVWLPDVLPKNVKIIVSYKRDEQEPNTPADSRGIEWEVSPFLNKKDRYRLVEKYLSQYLKELDPQHLEALIASRASENPLYLKVVLSELRVFGVFAGLAKKIQHDFGDNPESAFQAVLRRMENDASYASLSATEAIPLIFGCLSHARQGLSLEELVALLIAEYNWAPTSKALSPADSATEADSQSRIGQARDTINLYLRQLRPFLTTRAGLVDCFYESFRNAALRRYEGKVSENVPMVREAQHWHEPLAECFLKQANSDSRDTASINKWLKGRFFRQSGATLKRTWSEQSPRAFAELLYHQIHAHQWDKCVEELSDETFRQRCTQFHGPRFYVGQFNEFIKKAKEAPNGMEFINQLCRVVPINDQTHSLFRLLAEGMEIDNNQTTRFLLSCTKQPEDSVRAIIAMRALLNALKNGGSLPYTTPKGLPAAALTLLKSQDKRVRWQSVYVFCRLFPQSVPEPLLLVELSRREHALVRVEADRQLGKV